jgi:replicative DNA helicase
MTTANGRPAVTSEILDRQPPRSLESERALLASITNRLDVCDDVSPFVRADDFYDEAHRRLYRHMLAMHDDGISTADGTLDFTVLIERLRKAGDYDFVGGIAYLNELQTGEYVRLNSPEYARTIADKAVLRRSIHSLTQLLKIAYDDGTTSADFLQRMQAGVDRLVDGADSADVATARKAVAGAMERVKQMLAGPIDGPAVHTGLSSVDQGIGGAYPGELVIIGGRPGDGKTALSLQIAAHHASEQQAVLFVSTEMGDDDLMLREICTAAEISGNWLRNGQVTADDLPALEAAAEELSEARLFIDDRPSPSVAEIRATARKLHRKHKLKLIVVDYVQRLRPADDRRQRHEQVGQMAAGLKTLARELSLPVICLAQLNRQAGGSEGDGRPKLSHLRESGGLESEADQCWLLFRPELSKPNDADLRGKAELIVAKNRNGETGTYHLHWNSALTLFTDAGNGQSANALDLF